MPVAAIDDAFVRAQVVGKVEGIAEKENGLFEVCVALAQESVGNDPGQLLNMLFGNSSLHEDVMLHDVELPAGLVESFGGPRHGLDGLRQRVGARGRALTCSVLKPQGLPPAKLADLARRFALGGIDYIKDDHGLADQVYSPFQPRVEAIADALRRIDPAAVRSYVPSLSGDLDTMRSQIAVARAADIDTVLVAPMIMGWSNFNRIVRENTPSPSSPIQAWRAPRALLPRCCWESCSGSWVPMPSCFRTMADASATPQMYAVRSPARLWCAATGCDLACRCRPAA
jgi:ribulose-bisphosphate carboxylase large chain